jgi:hypothetical protein
MSRSFLLTVLVALSVTLLGSSRCGEYEALPPEVWREDVAPPFDYGLYCDARGKLVGESSGVLLVHRSEHLEKVFEDARQGDARARELFHQLEEVAEASGVGLADKALSLGCRALPTCTVRWAALGELIPSQGPGGVRLRQLLGRGFEQQARREHVESAVISAALDVLLVGGVAMAVEGRIAKAEVKAGAAEAEKLSREAMAKQRLVLPEVEGRLSLEEAAALEARLQEAEALEEGARQSARLETLARQRPSLQKPPPGVAADSELWADYVAYWEKRYEELAGIRARPAWLPPAKPPLLWVNYTSFLDRVRRGLRFQGEVARTLRNECTLAEGERSWLRGLTEPVMDENLGLAHERSASITFADQFVVDKASLKPGSRPIVHSFSNKQRDFNAMDKRAVKYWLEEDAREALTKYGGVVEVRRPGHPLFGREVAASKVHLVYDGKLISDETKKVLLNDARQLGVELHFHAK